MTSEKTTSAVRARNLYTTGADVGIVLIILSIALQFTSVFGSFMLAAVGIILASFFTSKLRKAIGYADIRTEDLDEYQMQQHAEAREDGLRNALIVLMVMFLLTGVIAVGTRFVPMMDGIFVTQIYFKLLMGLMVWIPLSVARSLAGKISRDELISSE
ncbi:hypothetical protein [Corynebacterium sp.]|uniref:hypothetical protein n=1 Tax=Corynebacterium sp. TaxID=1720 RepID=UPI0026DC6981|nr:hypothetical protein [Corynebacterium sp.]MDO5031222.1 hypothetical protein [Corynebacterium sp.]